MSRRERALELVRALPERDERELWLKMLGDPPMVCSLVVDDASIDEPHGGVAHVPELLDVATPDGDMMGVGSASLVAGAINALPTLLAIAAELEALFEPISDEEAAELDAFCAIAPVDAVRSSTVEIEPSVRVTLHGFSIELSRPMTAHEGHAIDELVDIAGAGGLVYVSVEGLEELAAMLAAKGGAA